MLVIRWCSSSLSCFALFAGCSGSGEKGGGNGASDKDDGVDAQLPNPAFCPLQHPSSSPWSPLLCQA